MASISKHRKGYRVRWIDATGKRNSETYALEKDAKLAAKRYEVEVDEMRRGVRRMAPPKHTLGEAFDYWLEYRAPRKKSAEDDVSIIRKHLRPSFAHLQIAEFTTAHLDKFCAARGHLKPRTLCNLLALLNSVMNMSKGLGWVDTFPAIKKPRVRVFDQDFRYLKTTDEVNRFLAAANTVGGQAILALFATAVYTGMRAGELAGLHWSDIDLDQRRITVHRSYGTTTKANDVRYIPIQDALLPLLRQRRMVACGPLVFTSERGTMLGESARAFQEVFHRALKTAGLHPQEGSKSYITFHGLRHTFASHMVMNGCDLFKLQKILGHKTVQMTMRYAHLQPAALQSEYGRMPTVAATAGGADALPLRITREGAPHSTGQGQVTPLRRRGRAVGG